MKFFYVRTSAKDQNPARQIEKAKELGVTELGKDLFVDQMSGKTFNRDNFVKLKEILKVRNYDGPKGDVLYVHELDRFGRNYDEVKRNITDIENMGVEIIFLDMPVIKTGDKATDSLLRDQFINTLSYVAQKETEKREARQRQGYDALERTADGKYIGKNGKVVGRPKKAVDYEEFARYYDRIKRKELKAKEAMKLLGIPKTRFYQIKSEYENTINEQSEKQELQK